MGELEQFYERYIAAFNASDEAAFAACFHPPVTVVHATRYDERRAGRALAVLDDLSTMALRPARWHHTTVDAVTVLAEAGPPLEAFDPAPPNDRHEARPGLITVVTRWDHDGRAYQRIRTLYLLTREQGELGIKVLVEQDVADLA